MKKTITTTSELKNLLLLNLSEKEKNKLMLDEAV